MVRNDVYERPTDEIIAEIDAFFNSEDVPPVDDSTVRGVQTSLNMPMPRSEFLQEVPPPAPVRTRRTSHRVAVQWRELKIIPRCAETWYSTRDLHERGWTRADIQVLLGNPDKTCFSKYGTGKLYDTERVRMVEESEGFTTRPSEVAKTLRRQGLTLQGIANVLGMPFAFVQGVCKGIKPEVTLSTAEVTTAPTLSPWHRTRPRRTPRTSPPTTEEVIATLRLCDNKNWKTAMRIVKRELQMTSAKAAGFLEFHYACRWITRNRYADRRINIREDELPLQYRRRRNSPPIATPRVAVECIYPFE